MQSFHQTKKPQESHFLLDYFSSDKKHNDFPLNFTLSISIDVDLDLDMDVDVVVCGATNHFQKMKFIV